VLLPLKRAGSLEAEEDDDGVTVLSRAASQLALRLLIGRAAIASAAVANGVTVVSACTMGGKLVSAAAVDSTGEKDTRLAGDARSRAVPGVVVRS